MPFKRAGWLQRDEEAYIVELQMFQCPLSGLVGCNETRFSTRFVGRVSMPFKRAGWLQLVRAGVWVKPDGFNAL